MTTIAFFNNKGGVGKTSLVYHLAWMFRELGLRVVATDLDPQANLTSMFLTEEQLEAVWPPDGPPRSVLGALYPLIEGVGDISEAYVDEVADGVGLIPGDLGLSGFEGSLSENWPKCLERDPRAFRIESAFWRLISEAIERTSSDVALIDVGPNLGAINRSALIAADYVVMPLGPDLFSLQGLRNLGPTLRNWRRDWRERLDRRPDKFQVPLPNGQMSAIGYVMMRHAIRLDRPVKAYARWIAQVPMEYERSVLGRAVVTPKRIEQDENCLAHLKDYRSLMPLAQENNKPMFFLRPADGAIGGHQAAVQQCYFDFQELAGVIAKRSGLDLA
jgi:chromosome partitioning protein